ncbi:MAG: class I SAM-dependent methyltransferase [Pseudonocardiaceae bacterium]
MTLRRASGVVSSAALLRDRRGVGVHQQGPTRWEDEEARCESRLLDPALSAGKGPNGPKHTHGGRRTETPGRAVRSRGRPLDSRLRSSWWDSFSTDRTRPVPFFVAKPDGSLISYLDRGLITTGHASDLGCGPGRNALHLASTGFTVDAVDLSPTAIAWAKDRAREAGAKIQFHCGDAFTGPPKTSPRVGVRHADPPRSWPPRSTSPRKIAGHTRPHPLVILPGRLRSESFRRSHQVPTLGHQMLPFESCRSDQVRLEPCGGSSVGR